MSDISTKAMPEGHLPVVIRPLIKPMETQPDIYAVASIDCPMLGVVGAALLFAPRNNVVALASPCGCHVETRLSGMILALSEALRKAEHGSAGGAGGACGVH